MILEVKKIPFNKTFVVRHPVLRANRPVEECYFEGDGLPSTTHFGLFDQDNLVGVLSVFENKHPNFNEGKVFQIRGMALLKEYQNKNLGVILLNEAEAYVNTQKGTVIWFNAREKAVNFYKKNGFQIKGTLFEIPQIGSHYLMFKQLT
jgi:ribosomal protein S18 acetylase RimI-like enzyme